ncbi:MAG TPA: MarR family transcriptional regulator [Gemmatimonadales bacterium]|jgi:DNA-binding MarR family transcriptional regulator
MNKSAPAPPAPLAHLLEVAHGLEARLEEALGAAGLSGAKLGVLRALAEAEEPLALSEVAERVRCVRSNVTQLVDRLVEDGFVRRVGDAADRRIRRATLTTAGRKAYATGTRVVARVERVVAGGLTRADTAALRRALAQLGGGGEGP